MWLIYKIRTGLTKKFIEFLSKEMKTLTKEFLQKAITVFDYLLINEKSSFMEVTFDKKHFENEKRRKENMNLDSLRTELLQKKWLFE